MSKGCPPVTVDLKAVADKVKEDILGKASPVESVHSTHVKGLGNLRLVPSGSDFDGTDFVLGFVTLPSVVNFATKLMNVGVMLPQLDIALSRSVATGLTLVAHVLTGGKSFLLGTFLGQFPSTLDSLAEVAVGEIVKAKAAASVPVPTAPAAKGIGQSEAQELMKLRRDLERLSGMGQEEEEEMAGTMVVNGR